MLTQRAQSMVKCEFDANLIAATITNNDNENVRNIFDISHSSALQINKMNPTKTMCVHLAIYAIVHFAWENFP